MARNVESLLSEPIGRQSCRVGLIPKTQGAEPPAQLITPYGIRCISSTANCRYKSIQNGQEYYNFCLPNLSIQKYLGRKDVSNIV